MPTNTEVISSSPKFERTIKVPNVICQRKVQEFGDLVVPAPCGVTLNLSSGKLEQRLTIEPVGGVQLRNVTVLKDKVINMGVVPIRLLVDGQVVYQLLEVPFQTVVDCPGARPGNLVQKHDFEIEGFAIAALRQFQPKTYTLGLYLVIKVVVQFCLVVAEETLLNVEASETFC